MQANMGYRQWILVFDWRFTIEAEGVGYAHERFILDYIIQNGHNGSLGGSS